MTLLLAVCSYVPKKTYDSQDNFRVTYLNGNMKMINCSRDAVQPLKFRWMIQKVGFAQWSKQANQMMECTSYLKAQLDKIGWPSWSNQYSNMFFFKRPSQEICDEYVLALGYDERFGGELAHVVVMLHVTKAKIDQFISALKKAQQTAHQGAR